MTTPYPIHGLIGPAYLGTGNPSPLTVLYGDSTWRTINLPATSGPANCFYATPNGAAGPLSIRAITGPDLGTGWSNTSTLFLCANGTWATPAGSGGGAVSSVAGTANQITASPTTGSVVLTLPNAIITPGSLVVTTTTELTGNVGIGGASVATHILDVSGSVAGSGALGPSVAQIGNGSTLTYAANSESGIGLYLANSPTLATTNSGYTGLAYYGQLIGTPTVTGTSGLSKSYQLYVSSAATATTSYGIYQAGTDANVFSGIVQNATGSASAPSVTFSSGATYGMYLGSGYLGLTSNGAVAVKFDTSQNATFGGAGIFDNGWILQNNYAGSFYDSGGTSRRGVLLTAANAFDFGDIDNAGYLVNIFAGTGQAIFFRTNGATAALTLDSSQGASLVGTLGVGGTNATNVGIYCHPSLNVNNAAAMQTGSSLTASGNNYGFSGIVIADTLTLASYTGTTYNGLNMPTPTVASGTIGGGYMISIGAPATGMAGALNIVSGAVNLGSGTTTVGGNMSVSGTATFSGPLYAGEGSYSGGVLMGNSATAPSNQLYSYAVGNTGLISGGYFNSSSQRVANVTNPAEIQVYNGQVTISANTGATVSSVYSLNTVATFTASGASITGSFSVTGTSTLTGNVGIGGAPVSGNSINIAYNSATVNPIRFIDSNTGGQTWYMGPGVGAAASQFGFYNVGNTINVLSLADSASGTTQVASNFGVTGNVAIGGSVQSNWGLFIAPTYNGANTWVAFGNNSTWEPVGNNQSSYGFYSNPAYIIGTYTGHTTYGALFYTPTITGSGTIANAYQIYIAQGATATNSYGIYQAGTNQNVLAGNVTVGSASGGDALIGTANTGANNLAFSFVNTGGTSYLGLESSAGGHYITGSSAYAMIMRSANAINFATGGGTLALTLDTSQNATFTGGIIVDGSSTGGPCATFGNTSGLNTNYQVTISANAGLGGAWRNFSSSQIGLYMNAYGSQTLSSTGNVISGIQVNAGIDSSNTKNWTNTSGAASGIESLINVYGSGTISSTAGIHTAFTNAGTGTVTTAFGIVIGQPTFTSGTTTNYVGLSIGSSATATNRTALFVGNQSSGPGGYGTPASGVWDIYVNTTNANYMAGSLVVGGALSGGGYLGIGTQTSSNAPIFVNATNTASNMTFIWNASTWAPVANGGVCYGYYSQASYNTGTYTGLTAYGMYINTPVLSGTGTISTQTQLYIGQAGSTGGGTTVSASYGIYQGGNDNNFFAGVVTTFGNNTTSNAGVGICQNSPSTGANKAVLHIGCGNTTTVNQDAYIYLQSGSGSGGARTWDLHVSGANAYFEIADSGGTSAGLKINYSGSVGITFYGYGAGTLSTNASGVISASSDIRLKDVYSEFNRGLNDIIKINPKNYKWKRGTKLEDNVMYSGFIAQDVEQAIPEAIGLGENNMLTLMDRPIIAALVNSIKELNKRIQDLEKN